MQCVIAIVVALVFLTRTAINEPYISDSDDLTDVLANIEVFCLLFAALLIKVTSSDCPAAVPRLTAEAMRTPLLSTNFVLLLC